MDPPAVDILVTDRVTDDVLAGLALFAELTGLQPARQMAQRWRCWLENTPFGNGLSAVAKRRDEVVGFYGLMPFPMRIGGRAIRAAKGEFFAVKPGYRNAPGGPTGEPVPFALTRELPRAAGRAGLECVQLVSTPIAAFCHAAGGARPLSYDAVLLVTCWSPPGVPILANRVLNAAARLGVVLHGRLARSVGMLRCRAPRAPALDTPAARVEWPSAPDASNLLMEPSPEMLAHRFGQSGHLVYEIKDADRRRAVLVFTMPAPGASVKLKYWSSPRLPPDPLLSVVKDVLARCRAARAGRLTLTLPAADEQSFRPVAKLGFLRWRRRLDVHLHLPTGLEIDWDPSHWRFTDAHTGLIDS
jgi:hypothetical protein